jgi:hypothetical protein
VFDAVLPLPLGRGSAEFVAGHFRRRGIAGDRTTIALELVAQPETLARMTSPAILEIQIAAKGSLAVMASSAGVVSAGEVFEGPRRADLSFLRQACRVVMTIGAAETLSPTVLRVTEGKSKRGRVG